jgi:hypothetical protein
LATRRLATCPTCMSSVEFILLGEQTWPAEVAEKLGLPATITLWSCPHCLTTVSEPDLLPYQRPAEQPEKKAREIETQVLRSSAMRLLALDPLTDSV